MGRPPLQVGETSIDTVSPYAVTIKGKAYVRIGWSIRLPGEAKSRTCYTTAMQGTDAGELRRRAHLKADVLLREARDAMRQCARQWTPRSSIADYLNHVTLRVVLSEPDIRPRTRTRYRQLLGIALEEAGTQSIESFCAPRALVDMLRGMALRHGTSTAIQLKRWMGKYVMRQLVMDGVIAFDPLRDLEVTLPNVHRGRGQRTSLPHEGGAQGVAKGFVAQHAERVAVLTPGERARVIEFLLGTEEPFLVPYQGPLTREQVRSFRRTLIDMTLVHATCGLRTNECRSLLVGDVDLSGTVPVIEIRPEISKTHRGRKVPLFDPRWGEAVAHRLIRRTGGCDPSMPLFGAARDASKLIQPRCVATNTRKLYDLLSDTLDIPLLHEVSTHVWRASLNTEWQARGMPPAMCSALFGHTASVNSSYYTAAFDPELICQAAKRATERI